jgi:hypothetical protein
MSKTKMTQCEKYHQCNPTQLDENLVVPLIELASQAEMSIYEWYYTICMGLMSDDCPRKQEMEKKWE